ncbi:MAG TPA: TylF/MycF family methyltransferase [Armatimonadota bacterium]|jgi:hypothetical protein
MDAAVPLYLNLIKRCLTNSIYAEYEDQSGVQRRGLKRLKNLPAKVRRLIVQRRLPVLHPTPTTWEQRSVGLGDAPQVAHTMIGQARLDNIQMCMEDCLDRGVRGDFIETGVWKGGATILMRAVLKAYGVTDRKVFVADSFEGLPRPNEEKYPQDKGDHHFTLKDVLAISVEQVQENFRKYDLLDDQVVFLKGWFSETLPKAPIGKLAVARLDGDMYESTMDAITNLYPKLSVGGYLIVDDYNGLERCKRAIEDYRRDNGITDEIISVDWTGVYWQKTK